MQNQGTSIIRLSKGRRRMSIFFSLKCLSVSVHFLIATIHTFLFSIVYSEILNIVYCILKHLDKSFIHIFQYTIVLVEICLWERGGESLPLPWSLRQFSPDTTRAPETQQLNPGDKTCPSMWLSALHMTVIQAEDWEVRGVSRIVLRQDLVLGCQNSDARYHCPEQVGQRALGLYIWFTVNDKKSRPCSIFLQRTEYLNEIIEKRFSELFSLKWIDDIL